MRFFGFAILPLAAASASAFAPTQNPPFVRKYDDCCAKPAGLAVSHVALEMASRVSIMAENKNSIVCERRHKQSKRMIALKILGKVVGVIGTIALATGGAPSVALAARGVRTTKKVVQVVETVQTVEKVNRLVAMAAATTGSAVACIIAKRLVDTLMCVDAKATKDKIAAVFPGAIKNKDLVFKVKEALTNYDYGSDSLLVTSLGPDEVNRMLEKDFGYVFKENFNLGGLAGFPFGGATAFANMAAHIPDGGSCLVVFGPHVGVDSKGNVGTVERRGRTNGSPCCDSAIAAAAAVAGIVKGGEKAGPHTAPLDAQQIFVIDMLLPYADRLEKADDKMVELPYCMYDAQKKMMAAVVNASRRAVAGSGKIAVLGGIQINTPEDQSDYYLPLSFEIYNKKGRKLADLRFL